MFSFLCSVPFSKDFSLFKRLSDALYFHSTILFVQWVSNRGIKFFLFFVVRNFSLNFVSIFGERLSIGLTLSYPFKQNAYNVCTKWAIRYLLCFLISCVCLIVFLYPSFTGLLPFSTLGFEYEATKPVRIWVEESRFNEALTVRIYFVVIKAFELF